MRAPILALLLSVSMAPACWAQGAAEFAATTVHLTATGQSTAAPDLATLSLGVTAKASTAAEALKQDSQAMNQVLAALHATGAQDRDIRTSGLSVQAQYVFADGQRQRLTGYLASNHVTVTVADLGRLGPMVDAAVSAGANEVNGVGFTLRNSKAAEDEARLEAVKILAARAELYAKAAGYRVARLVSLSEGERASAISTRLEEVVVTAARIAPTPISSGEVSVRVQLEAVYELTR